MALPSTNAHLVMEDIKQQLMVVAASLKDLKEVNGSLHERLSNVERHQSAESRDIDGNRGGQDARDTVSPIASGDSSNASSNADHSNSIDIQSEFTAIKDTLCRVKLPADLKVPDSRVGIRAQFSHQASVIQKCGKFSETMLKILSLLDESQQTITSADLHDLRTVAVAQTRYLQEEFASTVVESKYGGETAQTFRSLQRNISIFPPSVIDRVETAVNLSNLSMQRGRPRGRYQGFNQRVPYGMRSRGRGRGYSPYTQYAQNMPENSDNQ